MHPYRMQQLFKERGKDEVINVRQRTSIYQTIERLLRNGLIKVKETVREVGRPDRTIYESTKEGGKVLREWLREMLSTPLQEFQEFPVAISFLALLTIDDVQQQLEKRIIVLDEEWRRIHSDLETYQETIPRLFMLESEYKRAVLFAEIQWIRSLLDDIRSGALVWNEEWWREIANRMNPPNLDE